MLLQIKQYDKYEHIIFILDSENVSCYLVQKLLSFYLLPKHFIWFRLNNENERVMMSGEDSEKKCIQYVGDDITWKRFTWETNDKTG
jgi:hypothetical protein